jgi:hypothetical protein
MPQQYPVMIQIELPRATARQRRFAVRVLPRHLDGIAGEGTCVHETSERLGWIESRWTIIASSRSRAQSDLERVARQLARRVENDLAFARHGLRRVSTGAGPDDEVLSHTVRIG